MSRVFRSMFLATLLAGLVQIPAHAQSATPIPAGSVVEATLVKPLDAKKNKVGDEVTAKVTSDLKSNGAVVIAKGSKIVGHLTDVKAKSKDQPQSTVTITFENAMLKDGGAIPITVTIQALSKPADDRTLDVSDAMRGTAPTASAGSLTNQATQSGGNGKVEKLGPQSQGVLGYNGLGLQDASVYSPYVNVHLDAGTQMILQVSGK